MISPPGLGVPKARADQHFEQGNALPWDIVCELAGGPGPIHQMPVALPATVTALEAHGHFHTPWQAGPRPPALDGEGGGDRSASRFALPPPWMAQYRVDALKTRMDEGTELLPEGFEQATPAAMAGTTQGLAVGVQEAIWPVVGLDSEPHLPGDRVASRCPPRAPAQRTTVSPFTVSPSAATPGTG